MKAARSPESTSEFTCGAGRGGVTAPIVVLLGGSNTLPPPASTPTTPTARSSTRDALGAGSKPLTTGPIQLTCAVEAVTAAMDTPVTRRGGTGGVTNAMERLGAELNGPDMPATTARTRARYACEGSSTASDVAATVAASVGPVEVTTVHVQSEVQVEFSAASTA